jgi:transposase
MTWRAVTDEKSERIRKQLPRRKRCKLGGRPSVDDRQCFEGILWILWTGASSSEFVKSTARRARCIAD